MLCGQVTVECGFATLMVQTPLFASLKDYRNERRCVNFRVEEEVNPCRRALHVLALALRNPQFHFSWGVKETTKQKGQNQAVFQQSQSVGFYIFTSPK